MMDARTEEVAMLVRRYRGGRTSLKKVLTSAVAQLGLGDEAIIVLLERCADVTSGSDRQEKLAAMLGGELRRRRLDGDEVIALASWIGLDDEAFNALIIRSVSLAV